MTDTTRPEDLARGLFEALNDENKEEFVESFGPGARIENGGDATDVETLWEAELTMFEAFPDHVHAVETIVTDDRSAAVEFTFSGTHEGEYDGIPPSGNHVSVLGQCLFVCTHAGIDEWRIVSDSLGFYSQLGAIEPPYDHRYEAFR